MSANIRYLDAKVASLSYQNVEYFTGNFLQEEKQAKYLDVAASIIGVKIKDMFAALTSSGTDYTSNTDSMEALTYDLIISELSDISPSNNTIATIMAGSQKQFTHPFAFSYGSYFLQKSHSNRAVDFFARVLPGGMSYSAMAAKRLRHVHDFKAYVSSLHSRIGCCVIGIFDNDGLYKFLD